MNKKKLCLLVLMSVLFTAGCALRQSSGQGPQEGIKVHGHWTIEVRDPDGTLVTRREFDNALDLGGRLTLAVILVRQESVGGWEIWLGSANDPCLDTAGPGVCKVAESTNTSTRPNVFKNLTVGRPAGRREVILSGSATAQKNGNINFVQTFLKGCEPTVSPSICPGNEVLAPRTFALTALSAPVPVSTGQQIQVTVTISFS